MRIEELKSLETCSDVKRVKTNVKVMGHWEKQQYTECEQGLKVYSQWAKVNVKAKTTLFMNSFCVHFKANFTSG